MDKQARCWVALKKNSFNLVSVFTTWKRTRVGGQVAVFNGLKELFVFRYSIERTSDLDKYFYIDITSGALMTVRTLDREEMSWHNITVLAMEMSKSHQVVQLHLIELRLSNNIQ